LADGYDTQIFKGSVNTLEEFVVKFSSINDLKELRKIIVSDLDTSKPQIVICAGTACQASESNDIIRAAKRHILGKRLLGKIGLRITGCHGFCEMGPFILTEPQHAFYSKVSPDVVAQIIDATIDGELVDEFLYADPVTGTKYYTQDDIPFFKKQERTIFRANQKIDPIRIYDYIANNGYRALEKVIADFSPGQVVEEVKASGLRGRGGAGFPTGFKWELLSKQSNGETKYLVCNADEGDPGAYMDRSLLEGNPHSIIEGMIIGAYGTGATEGIVYVRNEYPLAIKHLIIALNQARDIGLLGDNILGTDFSFDIRIVKGAGAFVCGEETALIKSIEGKMGEPRQRPPFPIEKGIYGQPTAINNVETWANIPIIIDRSAIEYDKIGTDGNSGTKIFSLVGKIKNTGLVEVPMGITIKEIVYEIGGGASGSEKIKAVQTGGPSGGCIPAHLFDLPIDYDSLAEVGSIMGSGGMIVMDEGTCIVDIAKYFMGFLKDESCGKCFTCRMGTQRMWEILDDITRGHGTIDQLDLLTELAEAVRDTTMCGLGQSAANPVLSTVKYFRDEYIEHIVNKRCPAGVCSELVGAPCQNACPVGTEPWRYIALIEQGEYEEAYKVIREPNPFPSVCARVCHHPCEQKCRLATTGEDPVAVRALKRFVIDNVDPSVFQPERLPETEISENKVAVVGAGPAGLTAAHNLSLAGIHTTIFEAEEKPGGMLVCAIPEYRLPRDILSKEIDVLIDDHVTVKLNTALGRDFTINDLFNDGYKAVFLSMGAHKSQRLNLEGEDSDGVYPSIQFLKSANLRGESLAKGRVGIIGGGNSAVDAARTAFRQPGVDSVTIIYRRTRLEMPAYREEIEAAMEEGIEIRHLVSPARIILEDGKLTGVECIENELGDIDSSGRRRPVPVKNSEFTIPLDTLIVGIGEKPDSKALHEMGIEAASNGTLIVDPDTLATNMEGVFAGGDLVTGPNTVVEAVAMGKKAALMISRYMQGKKMAQVPAVDLPDFYIEPIELSDEEADLGIPRVEVPMLPVESRVKNYNEVDMVMSDEAAKRECRRCLRCDLEFTRTESDEMEISTSSG